MATTAILRPALHKVIHRYGRLSTHSFREEQEWVSGDETEDEDNYSVYSDEYISQEEYSEDEAEEDQETVKHYTVNLYTTARPSKRRKF
tara:strand:+ start:4640 stop:4906 length:267 start_codon:yes stop_codon:yes gene_type:complete